MRARNVLKYIARWWHKGVTKMRFAVGAVVLVCCAACAPSWWTSLPEQDRQRFERCREKVTSAQCGRSYEGDFLSRGLCTKELMEKYVDTGEKQRWLIGHGCPPAMVNAY